ncbi:metallophosphoesterase [Spirosoma aureum]|uniref:Metallophosphoesterase n=1 Tax=Spirosoma aureum TaxID=2692134 RepID=A0A6G9ALJ8_9BACT|nr:metallophosphoesterase [Spirosoma aureum]QIP13214.1 metallophosphoesterase [Spirosoma aureum]
MTILTISDLHGRSVWREADLNTYDQVIFLGDYTDSYIFDDETIYNNLSAIIELKHREPNRFVLLIGNHDAQYLHYPQYRCSGFRSWAQPELSVLFDKHRDLFQVAYQHGSYLFSHAGVTNQWLARLLAKTRQEETTISPDKNLADLINNSHKQPLPIQSVLFEVSARRGGYDAFSGPVWADQSESSLDYLLNFHQVVGHTPVDKFTTIGTKSSSITYTDVLQTRTAFYEIIIPD